MNDRPYVVLLTGGYRPGDEDHPPEPRQNDIDLTLDRSGFIDDPGGTLVSRIVAEAFKVGWHQAAQLGRIAAVWVVDSEETAQRFAKFVSQEVDPAFVRPAGDPLGEALLFYEDVHRGPGKDEAAS